MKSIVRQQLDAVEVKPLGMGLRPSLAGQASPLTPEERAGRVLAEIIHNARSTPKAFSLALGHADQSKVSRWMAGIDLPKLFVLLVNDTDYRKGACLGFAEIPGDDIVAETNITIPRSA